MISNVLKRYSGVSLDGYLDYRYNRLAATQQVSRPDIRVINWAVTELVTMTDRRIGNVA